MTENKETKGLRLKVAEAVQDDVSKGVVRIDSSYMKMMEINPGEVVEIGGEKKTAGIVDRAYPGDIGLNIIRMDGDIRRNAKTSIGEMVLVRKAKVEPAKKITIAPAHKGIFIRASPGLFKQGLLGRALVKGDLIALGGTRRRRTMMSENPLFGGIFPLLDERFPGFGFRDLKLVVVNVNPAKEIVIVTEETEVEFNPQAVEVKEEPIFVVNYEDIGGLQEEIKKVREMVELPLKHPEIFERLGVEAPKGVLLHGPPGTGKTLLAKAVASETNSNFTLINGPEIMSKFYGESEKNLRSAFEEAEKNAPAIIFIDEIDAIAPKREEVHGEVERRVVAQLLGLMDGLKSRGKVVVIAATNRANSLDPALRRPGRFDREIEIGVPSAEGRLDILKIHTRNMPLAKNVDLKSIAKITHGFVGADLSALAKEAAMVVLRRVLPDLKMGKEEEEPIPKEVLEKLVLSQNDFKEALKIVRPSAMREVLVETPDVSWNDIGGMEEIRERLEEAIEWPLKKPEAFKRMGIRPPKGILLYGPPGTGKTLLAKAVAKESEANFILVNGPSILSKWVGESLPYDEELIVFDRGVIKRMKIGEIVEKKKEVEVIAFDGEMKTKFSKISDFIKHPLKTRLLEIETKTGRKIKVTDCHSLFTCQGGEVGSILTRDIVPGKSYIAVPKKLPSLNEVKEIDLLEVFAQDKDVFVRDIGGYLKKIAKKESYKSVSEALGLSRKYLQDIANKNISLSLPKFLKLKNNYKCLIKDEEIKIGIGGSRYNLSAVLPITEGLCRLLGLWVAEGDYNNRSVRIHNSNKEIKEDIIKLCKSLSLPYSVMDSCITINSRLFKRVFEKVFGLKSGAKNKRVPALIFTLDKIYGAEFLKGYYSGDGSNWQNERKYVIEASTISKELANDLMYLLLYFGIVASNYKKTERSGNITYRIVFMGVDNFKRFKEIGFIDKERNDKIPKYISEKKWKRSDQIPLTGKLHKLISGARREWKNSLTVGRDKLKEVLKEVDGKRERYKEFWKLVEGDVFWDLVKSVREIPYKGFVYDISVNPAENFVGGFGGVFAHNSEKAIREIFRKARQTAPTILFFDEIDAIASRRGFGLGESRTGERMVNQLLTEMDGLESLNDVVIMAATNRPDIVDPALLRPGRFDRIIMTPVPDDKAREKIFEVHLRGMPLEKEVSIKGLAKKTEGYVGADIEGMCREAAMTALREDIGVKKIKMEHFEKALEKVKPSVDKEIEKDYKELEDKFKKAKAKEMREERPSYMG